MAFRSLRADIRAPLCLVLLAALPGCFPSEKQSPVTPHAGVVMTPVAASAAIAEADPEVLSLKAEVARLAAENQRLRMTPSAMAAEVRAAVAAQNGPNAQAALKRLSDYFPYSAELAPATKQVDALLAKLQAAEEEKKRIAALGFKGLRTRPWYYWRDTELRLYDTSFTRRWIFDNYGSGWSYLDPEKGQRLLTAAVSVSSKNKDPALFGMGAYVADGPTLKQVGSFRYRFAHWMDFGAVLGNHADFRNDFGHTNRIPFTIGASINQDDIKHRPLYLVVTREGCHKRHQDRLLQPPIHYLPEGCASLKKTLTVDDFKDGTLAVLKRID
jgi:hypothetical protein